VCFLYATPEKWIRGLNYACLHALQWSGLC
jgi:hypothetical protein